MAQVAESNLPRLDAFEIVDLVVERKRNYADRDALYELYQKYYRGKQYTPTPSVLAANAAGRPLLRLSESPQKDRAHSSQRLAPIIDDSQALLGRMPASRVEPPDPSEAGIQKAEKLTKYLVSTHELSNMDLQQMEMGYFLPGLGDGCYALEVDPDEMRVVWTVVDPSTAYPTFRGGHRRYEILDVCFHYYMDPYAAKARWGTRVKIEKGSRDLIPVTIYMSQYQRTIVVGLEEPQDVAHVEWNLRFCPAVWVWNKVNGQMANSDIAQSLVQQDALDFTWAVFLDGIVQNTYPVIGVRNALSLSGDPIQVGPGAPPVNLGPDGAISVAQTTGDLHAIQYGMQQLISDINVASGTSQIRQEGSMHSAIPTGRAAQSLQGPQATRVELKQTGLGAAIRTANSYTLEMQEKAPGLGKHEFSIYGRFKGQSFMEKMRGSEIEGLYRNSVYWDPVTGMNQQQKTAVAYEAKAAGLVDSVRAMEMTGEDDPEGMLQRVRREKLQEAQLQAQMQALMQGQPQQPGAPQGEAGLPTGTSGGQPAGNSQPPPTMIARPPGLGADRAQQPMAGGITRQQLVDALAIIGDRLKGPVSVVGDLADKGAGKHIQLLVADYRDTQRVGPIVKSLDSGAEIKVLAQDKWPSTATQVA